jgi:excisionase family DNA binding protein
MKIASKPQILENCISVKAAAEYSGYSQQYLRRLLRTKKLVGLKVGQLWLIDVDKFEDYIFLGRNSKDKRLVI